MARPRSIPDLALHAAFGRLDGFQVSFRQSRDFSDLLIAAIDYAERQGLPPFFDLQASLLTRDDIARLLAGEALPGDRLARYIAAQFPIGVASDCDEVRRAALRARLAGASRLPDALIELDANTFAFGRLAYLKRLTAGAAYTRQPMAVPDDEFLGPAVALVVARARRSINANEALAALAAAAGARLEVLSGEEPLSEGSVREALASQLARALMGIASENDPSAFEVWYSRALAHLERAAARGPTASTPGEVIRALRCYAGLTQEQLAIRTSLTESSIRGYEANVTRPPPCRLRPLAAGLGLQGEEAKQFADFFYRPAPPETAVLPFGTLLRQLRERAGLTRQELCARGGFGQETIKEWELEKSLPDHGRTVAIADALGTVVKL